MSPETRRRYFSYPDPFLRVFGMRAAQRAIEVQLTVLKSQMRAHIKAGVDRDGRRIQAMDYGDPIGSYRKEVDALFPKVLRGGYVVSLWALFESCTKNLAEYTQRECNVPFGLHELRAGDFLKQVEVFFRKVLAVEAFPDKSVRRRLQELKDLRNALAHHDGNVAELPESLRGQNRDEYLARGVMVFQDFHHEFAVPTAAYADAATLLVEGYFDDFAERLYKAVHPVPLTT